MSMAVADLAYVATVLAAVGVVAWWVHRDLRRAVARQRFEEQFAAMAAQWQEFQQIVGEALLPAIRTAAQGLSRILNAAQGREEDPT